MRLRNRAFWSSDWIKIRLLEWALIQSDCCPCKKKSGHRHQEGCTKGKAKKVAICKLEKRASGKTNSANTSILDFCPLELWENDVYYWNPQPVAFCYGSPNRLTQVCNSHTFVLLGLEASYFYHILWVVKNYWEIHRRKVEWQEFLKLVFLTRRRYFSPISVADELWFRKQTAAYGTNLSSILLPESLNKIIFQPPPSPNIYISEFIWKLSQRSNELCTWFRKEC